MLDVVMLGLRIGWSGSSAGHVDSSDDSEDEKNDLDW